MYAKRNNLIYRCLVELPYVTGYNDLWAVHTLINNESKRFVLIDLIVDTLQQLQWRIASLGCSLVQIVKVI